MSTPSLSETHEESVPRLASELWDMVLAYAKQETVGPLKGLAKFVAYGIGGAVVLGIGLGVLALAGLRLIQTHTGREFAGHESWIPYIIVLAAAILVAAVAVGAILSGRGSKGSKA